MRCNASRLSHAELDACEVLDDGDPRELARQYCEIAERMPWLNVFGGCCGTNFVTRHISAGGDTIQHIYDTSGSVIIYFCNNW